MTVRAVQVIAEADVIAYHSARHGRSIARSIAAEHLRADHIEEALVYPVTTETTDHPGGYQGAMEEFYAEAAARLAVHLDAGRTVAVLAEGDPLFYGSYMHMHKRLAGPLSDRGHPRRHLRQRRRGPAGHPARRGRGGADHPAGHPARGGADRPAGLHGRGGGDEAGPYVPRCARARWRLPGGSPRPTTSSGPR